MTGERGLSEERLAKLLTEALEQEANAIQVRDGWESIATRLVSSSAPAPRLSSISGRRRRRRAIGAAGIFVGVAAAFWRSRWAGGPSYDAGRRHAQRQPFPVRSDDPDSGGVPV
jgi:ferric-dicitrate binding protein FerR (iron transport regulator)